MWSYVSICRIHGFKRPRDEVGVAPLTLTPQNTQLTRVLRKLFRAQGWAAMGPVVLHPDLLLGDALILSVANISCWQLRAVSSTEHCHQPQGLTLPRATTLPRGQPTATTDCLWKPDPFASVWHNYKGLSVLQGSSKDDPKPRLQPSCWLASHSDLSCFPHILTSICPKGTPLPSAHNSLSQDLFPKELKIRSKTSFILTK